MLHAQRLFACCKPSYMIDILHRTWHISIQKHASRQGCASESLCAPMAATHPGPHAHLIAMCCLLSAGGRGWTRPILAMHIQAQVCKGRWATAQTMIGKATHDQPGPRWRTATCLLSSKHAAPHWHSCASAEANKPACACALRCNRKGHVLRKRSSATAGASES